MELKFYPDPARKLLANLYQQDQDGTEVPSRSFSQAVSKPV
jgi:hypothetical protein